MKDDLLWRAYEEESGNSCILQLVVPGQFREQIIHELHSGTMGGHLGTEKTHGRVKERFYWPGYWNNIRLFCEVCTSCATRKTPAPRRRAPLQSVQAGYPMEIVAMDLTGPFSESPEGNRYILVAGDYFTKWMEVYALPDQEATTVAKKLVEEFFWHFSVPDQLHSDQGKQFESHLISSICELLQVKTLCTTPYHPVRWPRGEVQQDSDNHAGHHSKGTSIRMGEPPQKGLFRIQHKCACLHRSHTFSCLGDRRSFQ